ncbi:unnamed protein product, partial [Adineta steineri]
SSTTGPMPNPLINSKATTSNGTSGNVKIDLSSPLSQMSVSDVCDCLKNDIVGLKTAMISVYTQDITEYNLSGQVLTTCELDELKQVLSMTFGDWVLFSNWIATKREQERRSRFHIQSQTSSTINNNQQHQQQQQHIPNNDAFHEYQFYSENSVLGAALNRLMSPTSQNTTIHSIDELRPQNNEGVSIISAPKNVKFLIPLNRTGITSNESTFGVIESTTRTITHVKDIFPLNPPVQSQITNNEADTIMSSSNTSSVFETGRRQDQNEI